MNTLAWLVVWTGFSMWPTHIDTLFNYGENEYVVRFVRDAVSDEWRGTHNGVEYLITRPSEGVFHIEDDTSIVATLGDDFWLTAEHIAVFSGGAGTLTITDYSVDWLDLRVIYIPVFIGFLTGMLFDIVFLPCYLVLRITGVASAGVLPQYRS